MARGFCLTKPMSSCAAWGVSRRYTLVSSSLTTTYGSSRLWGISECAGVRTRGYVASVAYDGGGDRRVTLTVAIDQVVKPTHTVSKHVSLSRGAMANKKKSITQLGRRVCGVGIAITCEVRVRGLSGL
jgi:hypothetical protein